jgi:hypothetical protein
VEALSAWLVPPWRPGDTSAGGSDSFTEADLVIYGPDDVPHELKLVLDAKRAKAGQGTIHLTGEMFYQPEQPDDQSGWFLIDSPEVRQQLEVELETVLGVKGIFEGGAKAAEDYRRKALRALVPALRDWQWLRTELGSKQRRVELVGGDAEPTGLVISTGNHEVTRFDVTFVSTQAGDDVLLLSQTLFWHPAVRPWEVLDQDKTWQTLQRALEPRFQKKK